MSKRLKPREYLLYASCLAVITFFSYAPVREYGFINYDDPQYITNNPHISGGLTWSGVKWAFTTPYQFNWHPLTWISHMIDIQYFGSNAGMHHLVNVGFHIANTVLLFLLWVQMTEAPGASALIAALFAVHPLHVESVAWIAERKDVLSTFFGLLALCGYVRYTRKPRFSRYGVVLGSFALSLMAKPMLVTLPFILLLLDFWPLRRFTLRNRSNLPELILEKTPLLILTAASSMVTFWAQRTGGSVVSIASIPPGTRIANAFVAYCAYIYRMIWPAQLAILYPATVAPLDWWWVAGLAILLLTVMAAWAAERYPYIPVGWFWFVGMLVPVIGLVQVGPQATADRYTYLSLVGLFVIIVFSTREAGQSFPAVLKYALPIAAALTIAGCMWLTRIQLQYWSTSDALWTNDLQVSGDNELAHFNLGVALQDEGKLDQAIFHFSEAARIEPQNADAQFSLATLLIKTQRLDKLEEAAVRLTRVLRYKPDFPEAHNALGIDYLLQGKLNDAAAEFSEAVRLKPDFAGAHSNLGTTLGNQGHHERAIVEYTEALRLDPGLSEARANLGVLLAEKQESVDAK